ncbi:MAG: hypothetical protein A2437_01140 [Bacteroidetes bacterium RIFOXYC2_FULL_40_12]|nr:MAG: hypothetical protein A2437_01140 [Bacteroidetes bacterium RIFOXYC2_FULL_40_12]
MTDDAGCTATISAFSTTAQNPQITATIEQSKISCFGLNDGEALVSPSGGTGSFTYNWSDGKGGSNTATGLSPSVTYTVTVSDATHTSCSITKNISVAQNPEITATISQTKISCFNANDGEALVTPAGGSASFTYLWDNADATAAATALTPAVHNVTVTDATHTSCSITKNITVAENPEIISTIAETKKACFGLTDGEALVTPSGGSGAFTYNWDNGNTTATATNLTPAIHNVTITDANHTSCSITKNITVTENTDITLLKTNSNYNSFGVSCFGASDGWIKVVPSNGTSPYTYAWNIDAGSQITQKAENLPIGINYLVTITDAIGCTKVSPNYSLDQPVALSITETITHVTYNGGANGQIQISVPDTSGTSNLYWTGYNTVNGLGTQTGLTAGNYQVTVVDGNNCSANESYTVNQPATSLQGGEISYGGVKTDYACYQTTSFAFSSISGYSGGNTDSSYVYAWQYSTNGSTWTTIPATNADIYTRSTVLTQDLYYRRAVTNAGVTAYSDTIFLDYIADPGLAYTGLSTEYCKNASDVTLIGSPTTSYGTFIGTGILSTSDGIATFSPSATDTTTYPNPITITYHYDEHGCVTELSKTTTIRPVPEPSFSLPAKISKASGSYVITDGLPAGGTFSGAGTTPEGTLYVSGLSVGTTSVTYSVTNGYSCSDSYTTQTDIVEGTGLFYADAALTEELGEIYCYDGEMVDVYVKAFNNDAGGSFEAPVSTIAYQHGQFDPSDFSGSSDNRYTIRYNYSGSEGSFTIEQEIKVYNVTEVAVINNLASAYCNYQQTVNISASALTNGDAGVFSGTGITSTSGASAVFNVNSASSGSSVDIKYVYTQSVSGCKDSVIQTVTINPQPIVSFDTKTLFNRQGEVYKFQNISPNGGIFSGEGISPSDSTFNPVAAKLGNNPVTYIFTDGNTCKDTASYTLVVENAKGTIVGIPANLYYCKDGITDTIIYTPADVADDYTPVKFEIDGNEISAASDSLVIDPALYEHGTHTIKYTYKGEDDITDFWITTTFQIDDIGTIDISVPKTDYCNYNEAVELKGLLNGGIASWGNFSGIGIPDDFNNDGLSTFYPTGANEGQNIVTYKYISKTGSTCFKTDSIVITVHPRPTIDFTLKTLYSSVGADEPLSGNPWGGYFTPSAYFINDTVFRPSVAGVGTHTLTYNYTDEYSCFNSTTGNALVIDAKGTIEELDPNNIYCSYGVKDTIYYHDADIHTPVSFTLDGTELSTGSDTAIISPSTLEPGSYLLRYNYLGSDDSTSFSIEQTITIDRIGNVEITLNDNEFCEYEAAITLTGKINGEAADKGYFTGTGIYPVDLSNDGSASFDPTQAGIGNNTITYTYPSTLENSSCYKSIDTVITVHPRPTLSFTPPGIFNRKGDDFPLEASPAGGTFGPASYVTDTIFKPSLVPEAISNVELTYTKKDGNECENTVTVDVVIQNPTGEFNGVQTQYCYDAGIVTFSVVGVENDIEGTGYFHGPGIISTNVYQATFNPQVAWDSVSGTDIVKEIPIFYTYKGTNNLTEFTISTTTKIRNNGVVTFTNLNSSKSYCRNVSTQLSATPASGTFSGDYMEGDEFHPEKADTTESTTDVTYTYTKDGCTIDSTVILNLLDLPELGLHWNSSICANILADTIVGNPRGGKLETTVFLMESIEGNSDSIRYEPNKLNAGTYNFKYSYTAPNGCSDTLFSSITINALPVLDIELNQPDAGFCLENENYEITGFYNNQPAESGIFSGNGIVDPSLNTGSGTFNPKLAGVNSNNPVTFTFTDGNGCNDKVSMNTIINALPVVSIDDLEDAYCSDYGELTIEGNASFTDGIFNLSINEVSQPVDKKIINISDYSGVDSIFIIFTATDANTSCTNSDTATIQINHVPDVDFDYNDICIADSIHFWYNGDTPSSSIDSYSWKFGDQSESSEDSTSHFYTTPVDVSVELKVTDNVGCSNSIIKVLELELNPEASFDWENECLKTGTPIRFKNHNTNNDDIYKYLWNFGDQSDSSTVFEPTHQFANTGAYQITYTIKSNSTNSSCSGTQTKTIHIRPTIVLKDMNDYSQSFEEGNGGWIPEKLVESDTVEYSWELGVPSGAIIDSAAHGENAYVTGLSSNYKFNENSAVTSPCFDFTELNRPMISLSIFNQMETRDGVVLEYSTDDGGNWSLVGKINEGINWYNSADIYIKPGNSESQGWTGQDTSWVVARHDLDESDIMGNPNVRFRLAFNADDAYIFEGFAFDNIHIGNRTRRVLMEHFSDYNNTYKTDSTLNTLRNNIPQDAIQILYESSIFDNNQLYLKYPVGVNARESYYNITKVPYTYFDGTTAFDYSSATPTAEKLMTRALYDPLFNIGLTVTPTGNELGIEIDLKALTDIENRQLQLFTAIVEKNVAYNAGSQTFTFQNVLRRFVPSPAGVYIQTNWAANETVSYSYNYTANSYIDSVKNLVVIAFVQDENNFEVLQTATSDTTSNTVGIEEWFAQNAEPDFVLFPNPASDEVYMVFNPNASYADATVQVLNQQGRVVKQLQANGNSPHLTIGVHDLAPGIYLVQWRQTNRVTVKKLMVHH